MATGDELDVIVVGAGLAGLACAYEAAGAGLQVAVLERGDAPGSKSLSGGR
ncbi:MAG: FAD-dependent oxidoreductase, partial [Candidatus Aminicenantes bacterium]|nr:FAD-dependent oxidoreductase [Candidatus Aminicenantes bacterium]